MFEGHPHILFGLLLAQNAIATPALRAAFSKYEAVGGSFSKLLLEAGLIDEVALLRAVAKHLGCDFVAKPPVEIPPEIVRLVSADVARSHQVVPGAKEGNIVTLLAAEPLSLHLEGDLAFALSCRIRLAVADPASVLRLIRPLYGEKKSAQVDAAVGSPKPPADAVESRELTEADIEKMAGQTPII